MASDQGRLPRLRWVLAALVLVVLGLILVPGDGAGSSTFSRAADGWWAFRAYLDARGTETKRIDRPLDDLGELEELGQGVLVLGLPWQKAFLADHGRSVGRHLRAGGTVILGYTYDRYGEALAPGLWTTLGTENTQSLRPPPPITPWAWWRYRNERWTIEPTEGFPELPTLDLHAFDTAPTPPAGATVLYALDLESPALDDEVPVIFTYSRLGGRVVILPSLLLSNAELYRAGNADLAESLRRAFDGPWRFDEYHHGVVAADLAAAKRGVYAWDLFVWHLALVYLLGVWTLARRFGPTWSEPIRRHGSTAAFLRSLGGLHHRLDHHRDAARLLVRRAHQLQPRPPQELAELEAEAENVLDGDDLVRLARHVG